jgi:nucleotide-binding universal stress UspA family protein
MDIKDILIPVSSAGGDRAACEFAARLAVRHGARVQGLCLTPLPPLAAEDAYAVGVQGVHDVLTRFDQETAAAQSAAEAPFRAAMAAGGCEFGWNATSPDEPPAETALRARLFDLVVMTRPSTHNGPDLRLAECVVRLGAAPCLLVPSDVDAARPLEHVVLAWNGSRQAKRAMDDALPFLQAARQVSVLFLGLADGLKALHDALIDHLARKGVNATIQTAPKGPDGVGIGLLDWCDDHRADLLVMGAFGHTPQTERWLGGTTWTALTNAQQPVLMSC